MAVERLWRRRSKEGVVGVDDEVDGVDVMMVLTMVLLKPREEANMTIN